MSARAENWSTFVLVLVQYFAQLDRLLPNPIVIDLAAFELTQPANARDELTGLRNYGSFSDRA